MVSCFNCLDDIRQLITASRWNLQGIVDMDTVLRMLGKPRADSKQLIIGDYSEGLEENIAGFGEAYRF